MSDSELNYQKKYWQSFAEREEKDSLSRDLHGSWDEKTQSYSEVTDIPKDFLEIIPEKHTVLDFGVGMGRNYDYLDSIFSEVYGFDTKEMVTRLKSHRSEVKAMSDLSILFSRDYDLVYESVALQHMPPQEVIVYLTQISKRAKYFFTWSRCYNDYFRDFPRREGGINMLGLIKSLNCFELVKCSMNPEDILTKMDETHFKALFKCNNYREENVSISADGGVTHKR